MQRPLVPSSRNFGIRFRRLLHAQVIKKRHNEIQQGLIAMQALQVHLRQLDRGNLPVANHLGQMAKRQKRDVLHVGRLFRS